MSDAAPARVLLVDDDENLLKGLQRLLRRRFETTVISSPVEALTLAPTGDFAVVVSDYRMPVMDGVTFLSRISELAPDTVRVLLTGHADVTAAVAAVNEGHVFRFLDKPCPPEILVRVLNDAVRQHRLVRAERVLLERTLHGSVAALVDVLSMAQPAAFGRASRVRRLVGELADALAAPDRWALEVAAMLSQIGTIALPPEVVDRMAGSVPLSEADRALIAESPRHAARIIDAIPRLEGVHDILERVGARATPRVGRPPHGADLLTVALDFDDHVSHGSSEAEAVRRLVGRTGWYDRRVLDALSTRFVEGAADPIFEVALGQVTPGMVFADDVRTTEGILLISRGQEVTAGLVSRIENFWADLPLAAPVRVTRPAGPNEAPAPESTAAGR
jgi:FixJ family two-component response regulator